MEDSLLKACQGRSASRGGLNVKEFREALVERFPKKEKKLRTLKTRRDLQEFCKNDRNIYAAVKRAEKGYTSRPGPKKEEFRDKTFLSGVVKIEHLTGDFGGVERTIWILYDHHEVAGECPTSIPSIPADQWILNLLETSEVKTDLFLETPIVDYALATRFYPSSKFRISKRLTERMQESIPMTKEAKGSTLHMLANTLRPCYRISKTMCPYPNARVHYVDVRTFTRFTDVFNVRVSMNVYLDFLVDIFGFRLDEDNYAQSMFDHFINPSKIRKQWLSPGNPLADDYTNLVKDYLQTNYRQNIEGRLSPFIQIILKTWIFNPEKILLKPEAIELEINDEKIRLGRESFRMLFLIFFLPIMDIYALGRMFKSFEGNPAQNIILYAGANHARSVSQFLQNELGFKIEYSATPDKWGKQCVDITDLKKLSEGLL